MCKDLRSLTENLQSVSDIVKSILHKYDIKHGLTEELRGLDLASTSNVTDNLSLIRGKKTVKKRGNT